MKTNKTDQLFQAKLGGLEPAPSPGAWRAIEQSLQKEKNRHRRKMLAIAASLILLAGLGFYLMIANGTNVIKVADGNDTVAKANPEIAFNSPAPLDLGDNFAQTPNPQPEKNNKKQETQNKKPETKDPKLHEEPQIVSADWRKTLRGNNVKTETRNLAHGWLKPNRNGWHDPGLDNNPKPETGNPKQETRNNKQITGNPQPETSNIKQETPTKPGVTEMHEKSREYPAVTITYKKTTQESPLASIEDNVVKKGMQKLSGFKDELKLSEEAKAKIRNTKEDILALNFGKIFNKTAENVKN